MWHLALVDNGRSPCCSGIACGEEGSGTGVSPVICVITSPKGSNSPAQGSALGNVVNAQGQPPGMNSFRIVTFLIWQDLDIFR